MAYMNCGRVGAAPRAFEAVIARHTLRALKALETLRGGADDDATIAGRPCGPGWFDSSWELVNGLDVCEGLPADAGLDEWLAVYVAG